VHGPAAGWDDRTELAAVACDRLADVLVLLQGLGGVRNPERPPAIPRPTDVPAAPEAPAVPPAMSSTAEVREFFGAAARYTPG